MPHVRGYRRADGTWVRPHHRRSRPAGTGRPVPAPRRVQTPATRPRPSAGQRTTRVRPHRRAEGTRGRGHRRRIGSPAAAAVAGSGFGGLVLLLLILAFLGSGAGAGGSPPGQAPTSPAGATG